ncbi:HAD family phosphatase [Alkalibacter rhizosphaerae]|uniref:HAD family phosphatase n=1 Tax=Alkalibacter rhizosphaerae TaxID=2815577 RepID=A0A974XDA2_9FIRM|nr:HAD family phosphatase [Alkalibacter rhizosphaerae]QSX07536.1 HAD family phosphatase [Alkalibacter rhizosphaerae]
MDIKGVIFDMDGVIVDSEPLHFESDRRTMAEVGVDLIFEDMKPYIGTPDRQTYGALKQKHGLTETVEDLLEKQKKHKEAVFKEVSMKPMEGLMELMDHLKGQGFKIGLASSSKKKFIRHVLDQLQITSWFDAVVSGEDPKRGKPEPDIFLMAAAWMGCEPEACIVIEDSTHGIQAARQANMFVYGLYNPNSGEQDLSRAHMIVSSLGEILIHLKTNSLDV